MINWTKLKLIDISNPRQWKNLPFSELKDDGYLVYGANGVIGKYSEFNHEYPTLAITCRGATCGSLHITEPKSYITSNAMALDDLKSDVNIKFLYYALRKRGFKDIISGSAQPQITREGLSKIIIDIPPLPDQIKIATVLSKAEALIQKKKQNISLLDDFLKSTFLKMFGDPVKNENGWEEKKLDELLIKIESGWSPVCKDFPRKNENEIGMLKLGAVTHCEYRPAENKALYDNIKKEKLLEIKSGDVLFTRKNTKELVAAVCYVFQTPPNLFLTDLIFRLKNKKEMVNGIYLSKLLIVNGVRKSIQNLATGAAGSMPNISKEKLNKFRIPVPPLSLQNEFAAIVEKTEALKEKLKSSLVDLENLYGALSQKAFKGELDLSNMEIDTSQFPKIESDSQKKQIHEMQFFSEKVEKKIPEKKPKDKTIKPLLDWGKVSSQQVADWIKEEFSNYHFNSEMLTNYLLKEKVNSFDYFTSEELLKNLKLNAADDLKSFVFSSLAGENPFLKLEQIFYNAEREDKNLQLREEDYRLIQKKSKQERSGIYFRIV